MSGNEAPNMPNETDAAIGLVDDSVMEHRTLFLSMPEQIAVQLAKDILAGALAENEKLSEQKLAYRFGVSRGPIRDAIKLLEQNGFVRSKPRLSARVNSVSRYEVRQLFELRAQILGLLARYAARNALTEELGELRKEVGKLHKMPVKSSSDVADFLTHTHTCWTIMHKAARARRISAIGSYVMGSAIWQRAFRNRVSDRSQTFPKTEIVECWNELTSALEAKDEEQAQICAEKSVSITWDMIKDTLDNHGARAEPE